MSPVDTGCVRVCIAVNVLACSVIGFLGGMEDSIEERLATLETVDVHLYGSLPRLSAGETP